MKKTLLLILSFLAVNISAQNLTLTPDVINIDVSGDQTEAKVGYTLANDAEVDYNWAWTLELGDDFPEAWGVQVCDQTLCWGIGTLSMGTEAGTNILKAQESTNPDFTYVRVESNGVGGSGSVRLCVYPDHNFDGDPVLCSSFATATFDINNSDINIFPNPAQDYFQISDSEGVSVIDIYNIVGKKVSSYVNSNNATFDISELKDGLYIVRLLNKEGALLKSMRLSKR